MNTPMTFENRAFTIRLARNRRDNYPAGSTLFVGEFGDVTATDRTGRLESQVPRERWVDITLDDGHVIDNGWPDAPDGS